MITLARLFADGFADSYVPHRDSFYVGVNAAIVLCADGVAHVMEGAGGPYHPDVELTSKGFDVVPHLNGYLVSLSCGANYFMQCPVEVARLVSWHRCFWNVPTLSVEADAAEIEVRRTIPEALDMPRPILCDYLSDIGHASADILRAFTADIGAPV